MKTSQLDCLHCNFNHHPDEAPEIVVGIAGIPVVAVEAALVPFQLQAIAIGVERRQKCDEPSENTTLRNESQS